MDTAPRPTGPLPEPVAQEWDLSASEIQRLDPTTYFAASGVSFDGRMWMRMASLTDPINETGLTIAIDPSLLEAARANLEEGHGAQLRTRFSNTAGAAVLSFAVELPATDENGHELIARTLIDPTADAPRSELNTLEQQEVIPIDFLDARTGDHLDRWEKEIDDGTRLLIQRCLFRTFGRPSDPLQWPWAALLSLGIHWRM